MPLPLPIMIPFMMWQSAAIAAGFGTYFQFAKRRVSAMSNDEFNKADPHELVNSMYNDIVQQIPSSFAKVDSLTPVMLQSMNVMLDQAVKWLQGAITGNFFGTPNPVNPVEPIDPALPEPSVELLSVSSETVSGWSLTKLGNEHFLINKYDAQSQIFIRQFFKTRITDAPKEIFEPPGGCPSGKHWNEITKQCEDDSLLQTIPWISLNNIEKIALGKAQWDHELTWFTYTNPLRNGNWIRKGGSFSYQGSKKWLDDNWDFNTHAQYQFNEFGDKWKRIYKVKKTDITVKNFPKP